MHIVITSSIKSFVHAYLVVAVLVLANITAVNAETQFNATTFGDWSIKCTPVVERNNDGELSLKQPQDLECALSQHIEFEDSSEPILKIDLYLNPQGKRPEAIFVLPLGIPLATAPILSFNNSKSVRLPVSHCYSDGCYFKTPLNRALLETFLSMRSGQLKLRGDNDQTMKIPISGKGSRGAYNYFEALPKD